MCFFCLSQDFNFEKSENEFLEMSNIAKNTKNTKNPDFGGGPKNPVFGGGPKTPKKAKNAIFRGLKFLLHS